MLRWRHFGRLVRLEDRNKCWVITINVYEVQQRRAIIFPSKAIISNGKFSYVTPTVKNWYPRLEQKPPASQLKYLFLLFTCSYVTKMEKVIRLYFHIYTLLLVKSTEKWGESFIQYNSIRIDFAITWIWTFFLSLVCLNTINRKNEKGYQYIDGLTLKSNTRKCWQDDESDENWMMFDKHLKQQTQRILFFFCWQLPKNKNTNFWNWSTTHFKYFAICKSKTPKNGNSCPES